MKISKLNNDFALKFFLVLSLVLLAVILRLLPHAPNFAPIVAIAIFGGALLPRKWALTLPLIAMIASDAIIGMHALVLVTWGSFLLIALASNKYLRNIKPASVFASSLGASLFFFFTTNTAVWLEGKLYPLTLDGLFSSYYNAIPFFRNTLVSSVFYSAILFGTYAVIYRYGYKRKGSLAISTN